MGNSFLATFPVVRRSKGHELSAGTLPPAAIRNDTPRRTHRCETPCRPNARHTASAVRPSVPLGFQSRPDSHGGSIATRPLRSRSTIALSAAAVAVPRSAHDSAPPPSRRRLRKDKPGILRCSAALQLRVDGSPGSIVLRYVTLYNGSAWTWLTVWPGSIGPGQTVGFHPLPR